MREQILMEIVEKIVKDKQLRDDMRKNPETAIKTMGYELTPEEWNAVKTFHESTQKLTDKELDERLVAGSLRQYGG